MQVETRYCPPDTTNKSDSVLLDWGNQTFSAQWTHLFSSKLFSHFVLAGSRFQSDTQVQFEKVKFGILNKIPDLSLKGALAYSPTTEHSMDFGFETKMLDFDLNYHVVDTDYLNPFSGNYYSLFLQNNYRFSPFAILQTGLRMDSHSDGNYFRFDPRISIKQLMSDEIYFTLTYGKYHQFLNLVQQEGMSFANIWFPVDDTFDAGSADYYICVFTYNNRKTFSSNVDTYYKNYHNIAEYRVFRDADETNENQTAAQNFFRGKG